jgi:hypothetical protein
LKRCRFDLFAARKCIAQQCHERGLQHPASVKSHAVSGSDEGLTASASWDIAAQYPVSQWMWDRWLQSIEAVVQRQQRVPRLAMIIASSAWVSTVDRGARGPVLRSSTVVRFRHLETVFGLIPSSRLSVASEACDRCIAALTACVPSRQICHANRLLGDSTWRSRGELGP